MDQYLDIDQQSLLKLNQFAIELAMLNSDGDLDATVMKHIKEFSGAEAITFSDYEPQSKTLSLRKIEMEGGLLNNLKNLVGPKLFKIELILEDHLYQRMISSSMEKIGSLHEAIFGTFSHPVSVAIETLVGVNRFIGISYIVEGELYGSSILAFRKGTPDPPMQALHSFISVAAVSLRRKRAEEELKLQFSELKKSQSLAQVGSWRLDLRKNIFSASDEGLRLFGFDPGYRPSFQEVSDCIHPDDIDEATKVHLKAIEMGTAYSGEVRAVKRNTGEIRNILILAEPQFDAGGKIVAIFGTNQDLTDRKKMEADLDESEAKFKHMADLLPQIVFETDIHGKLVYVNKQAFSIMGYDPEDSVLGLTSVDFYVPEDRARALDNIRKIVHGQTSEGGNEYNMIRKDGSTFPVLTYSNPIIRRKVTVGLRGIIIDISERKRAEHQLFLAKAKAEESDRLKSTFLANMSHEIRTPMNGILGFAELLKEPELTGEEQQRYISIIERSGARMLNIINDIVDISKIESGQMEVRIAQTNINDLIEDIYTFFRPEVLGKRMELFFHAPLAANDSLIYSDREKIIAILTNLVKNSIKYSNQGTIDFGYEKKGEWLEFFVKDTGIGISEDKLEMVFERFMQADINARQTIQGTGLGLSIAKAYVKMLGGQIWVESVLGQGSVFCFTIPYSLSDFDLNGFNPPSS